MEADVSQNQLSVMAVNFALAVFCCVKWQHQMCSLSLPHASLDADFLRQAVKLVRAERGSASPRSLLEYAWSASDQERPRTIFLN